MPIRATPRRSPNSRHGSTADRATKRDALIAAAQRDKAAAEKGEFPYRPHSHLQKWQRVTSTPRFLSLSAEIETYMGGAHGMTNFDTLLWDRNRRKRLKPLDLFKSGEAFDAAIRDAFCAGIKRAKAAKGITGRRGAGQPLRQMPAGIGADGVARLVGRALSRPHDDRDRTL